MPKKWPHGAMPSALLGYHKLPEVGGGDEGRHGLQQNSGSLAPINMTIVDGWRWGAGNKGCICHVATWSSLLSPTHCHYPKTTTLISPRPLPPLLEEP